MKFRDPSTKSQNTGSTIPKTRRLQAMWRLLNTNYTKTMLTKSNVKMGPELTLNLIEMPGIFYCIPPRMRLDMCVWGFGYQFLKTGEGIGILSSLIQRK